MEKLTLEHLSDYFPYGLKVLLIECNETEEVLVLNKIFFRNQIQIQTISGTHGDMYFKPILRPISDLTKEIEHKGERFVPIEWFEIGDDENTSMEYDHGNIKLVKTLDSIAKYNIHNDINYLPYGVAQKLIKWHFDVFGLIEKKLAIDINTLK